MSLLEGLNLKCKILHDEPLSEHTTFKIGGPAKIWAQPEDVDSLINLLGISRKERRRVFLIGEGSNLLVSGDPLDLTVISLRSGFNLFEINKNTIMCQAGCNLQRFILKTLQEGYAGLEFMAGIPGTVGGAVKMNAGAGLKGPWISRFIERIKVVDDEGEARYIEKKDLRFGYRQTDLKGFIILEAVFKLEPNRDKAGLLDEYKRFLNEKRNRQELSWPSAGCVFKNPKESGLSAAKLIEQCGLKGAKIGDAAVSTKHANFIVNTGKATFKDIISLIDLIKEKVHKQFKIQLEIEVEILR